MNAVAANSPLELCDECPFALADGECPQGRLPSAGRAVESRLNSELANIIPVVYGAVLSYALWVLAELLVGLVRQFNVAPPETSWEGYIHLAHDFGISVLFFAVVVSFLVEDVGEISKIARDFPYLRTSRYSHEILISFFFLASVALLYQRSTISVLFFGFAVGWGGVWCNQLKEEYSPLCPQLVDAATTQRNIQYAGGALFLIEGCASMIYLNSATLNYPLVILVCFTYLAFQAFYALYASKRHPEFMERYGVSIVVPDWLTLGNS